MEIKYFHSHIEVSPYTMGDCPVLERQLSKFDTITHSYIPTAFFVYNDTLYMPRGISATILQKYFNVDPDMLIKPDDYDKISDGKPLLEPKNKMQEDGIKFLCSKDEYAYSGRYSQLGLNLDTGDGKTYAAIYSILKLKLKTIIITHTDSIKQQWMKSFKEKTTFDIDNRGYNISGSDSIVAIMNDKVDADIYFVNHQTLHSYGKNNGWEKLREFFKKIRVGIKVIDEAHLFFDSICMIDYFSNCYKTFYLTATFGRSDPAEARLYKKAFSSIVRFGEETKNYEEKRKHINFVVVYFTSHPMYGVRPVLQGPKGFSSYKYIDYELGYEENKTLLKVMDRIINETLTLEGRTMILSPKIESANMIAKHIEDITDKKVGTIHSQNTDAQNDDTKDNADYISTTIKSSGTGTDIDKLRVVIGLEPVGSKDLASQMRGRLREFAPDKDTYFFYPVDLSIPDMSKMLARIMPIMKEKCKNIIFVRYDF